MYEFHKKTKGPVAQSASTLLIFREIPEFELFFVKRSKRSAFLGGAMVFPGGKLEPDDARLATTGVAEAALRMAAGSEQAEALAACACRETLEEAGVFPSQPVLSVNEIEGLRSKLASGARLSELMGTRLVDTASLVPFARWVTPEAEVRRFDARFFLTRLPGGQVGRHDNHETTRGLWASPQAMLRSFSDGEVFLAPPTLRCLELLAQVQSYAQAVAVASEQSLLPICPQLVPGEPLRLILPGHPDHPVADKRVDGSTAFAMDQGRFLSRDA